MFVHYEYNNSQVTAGDVVVDHNEYNGNCYIHNYPGQQRSLLATITTSPVTFTPASCSMATK